MNSIELDRILDALSSGGYLLTHHNRGSREAERGAILAANEMLGYPVEGEAIEKLFSESVGKEAGFVFASICINHSEDSGLMSVLTLAKKIVDAVGFDRPEDVFH